MLDQDASTKHLRAQHSVNCEENKNDFVNTAALSRVGIVSERPGSFIFTHLHRYNHIVSILRHLPT